MVLCSNLICDGGHLRFVIAKKKKHKSFRGPIPSDMWTWGRFFF